MADMQLPVALDTVSGALVRKALTAAAAVDGALGCVLADSFVRTVVLAVDVVGDPVVHLVRVVHAPDPLAQWADLSCI